MIDKQDILERLKAFCVGHPHAKIPWPHRELHEAAAEITRLRAELAAARDKALEEAAELIDKNQPIYGAEKPTLSPRLDDNRDALVYAAEIRALKGTPNAD